MLQDEDVDTAGPAGVQESPHGSSAAICSRITSTRSAEPMRRRCSAVTAGDADPGDQRVAVAPVLGRAGDADPGAVDLVRPCPPKPS